MRLSHADDFREDFTRSIVRGDSEAIVARRPLSCWERMRNSAGLRQVVMVAMLAFVWEAYARWLSNDHSFPTLSATLIALWSSVMTGELPSRVWASLTVLLVGYGIGTVFAFLLAVLAMTSRLASDLLDTLITILNPLPAIALLPLALLWFGPDVHSLVFVLVYAVLWPMALNAHAGFRTVPDTLRMVGRNCGLTGIRFMALILLPAALPSIIVGLRAGWVSAWRTLIAVELVSGAGGLGSYIFESKNLIQIPQLFAGLLAMIVIGLAVENVIFRVMERSVVQRWQMQRG